MDAWAALFRNLHTGSCCDLDLIVQASAGEERHGNVPAGSTGFDRIKNIEQVTWVPPPAGSMAVTVRAFRVTAVPQSYALVVKVS